MMGRYFAQLDITNTVVRVVVADSLEWCVDHLGGTWLETADPYSDDPQSVNYCGPGWGADVSFPERFAARWVQPLGADVEEAPPYPVGSLVFHNGRIWRSLLDSNVWEPGVANWRDWPAVGVSMWVQPTGAHDAYPLGDVVSHSGQVWVSEYAANVWEPGVFGWIVRPDETPDVTLQEAPLWVEADRYPNNALVTHLGTVWRSTRNNNRDIPGTSAAWVVT